MTLKTLCFHHKPVHSTTTTLTLLTTCLNSVSGSEIEITGCITELHGKDHKLACQSNNRSNEIMKQDLLKHITVAIVEPSLIESEARLNQENRAIATVPYDKYMNSKVLTDG